MTAILNGSSQDRCWNYFNYNRFTPKSHLTTNFYLANDQ